MFEYLMPFLIMPTFENTLLDISARGAVARQIEYSRQLDLPWGFSESGYNFTWPIIRGFYVAPKISEADYKFWLDSFNKLLASKDFLALRDQRDLYPFSMTGAELDAYVKKTVAEYRKVADEFGLIQK